MKNILLYTLLLTATLTYAQGLLPEEKVKKEPSAQPVQQTKKYAWKDKYYEGLAIVILNDKFGFIDKTGKEVIPIKYDYAQDFSEGLAKVKLNNKWGFIDKTGKEVIPIKYDDAESFSKSLAGVKLEGKWFYINPKGEYVNKKYSPKKGFFDRVFENINDE